MAAFCTKCGSPLPSETGFCPSCGTPVAAGVATPGPAFTNVPVPAAPPAQTAPPTYGQAGTGYAQVNAGTTPAGYPPPAPAASLPPAYPTAATSGGGGGALKIILIVLAVIVGLGVLAAGIVGYGVYRVAHTVKMNSNGDTASISVPGAGSMSVGDSTSTADLGVPIYPGATRQKGGLNLNSGSTMMVMAHFSTNDSTEQVVDFYKSRMGDGTTAIATGTNDGTVLSSGGKDTDRIVVTVGGGKDDDEGKTAFVIVHTKKK